MFVNFAAIQAVARKKLPFGIAQIGKSFRNEITPGNFIFRTREFEQMEMEFFVEPGTDDEWFDYWVEQRLQWYLDLGVIEGEAAPAPARDRRARALREGRHRHRVRVPVRLERARGDREPHRLRPARPPGGERRGPHVLRPGEGGRGTCPT